MSKPDAWMPFYPGDYLGDTRRLSLEQHGAYLLLILDYWRNGPPPDDEQTLARIIGSTIPVWRRVSPALRSMFKADSGVLRHKRIDQELETATNRKGKAVAKASAAAVARWAKENAPSIATSIPQALHEDCPSPSPSSLTTKAKAKARQRATLIPPDFSISDRVRQWAAGGSYGPLERHLEAFIGKARAKGYTYLDWDEAFMNCIREDWGKVRAIQPFSAKPNVHDRRAAVAAAMFAAPKEPASAEPTDITAESQRVA